MIPQDLIDYDIHGLVGVRLIDPSPDDVAAVTRQLGPPKATLSREPDLVVRFVTRLATERLRFVEPNHNAFAEGSFFILGRGAKARIPFDQIGNPCEIVCERGMRSVPLLKPILNLYFLRKDCIAVHGSAFVYKGAGVLLTSWAKGGKTTALLGFASRGASFVGDDWIILNGDGQTMYGTPGDIEVSGWHFESLANLPLQVRPADFLRLRIGAEFRRAEDMIPNGNSGNTLPLRALRKALSSLRQRFSVSLSPTALFGRNRQRLVAKPQKIFQLISQEAPETSVVPTLPSQVVPRLFASTLREEVPLWRHYLAFKYAFPGKANLLIERAEKQQRDILARAVAGKETYTVSHPYPVVFPQLYDAMRPFCETPPLGRRRENSGTDGYEVCDSVTVP